jgi:prepilin-type N-terminal cleavage/methylation domain-containing protein/prepilin-type processing-associated H-X9-DG protein
MNLKLLKIEKGNRALTLIEVLVVIVAVAVLLALVAPLNHVPTKAIRINCASNLKQVGLAFRVWEGDNGDHYPMQGFTNELGKIELPNASNLFRYFQVMSNELSVPKVIICPADKRTEADSFAVLNNTNISYFVGLDAVESLTNMLLTGDRNLVVDGVSVGAGLLTLGPRNHVGWSATMHKNAGNIGLADGSVQQVTSSGLQGAIAHSGTNVNRLMVP